MPDTQWIQKAACRSLTLEESDSIFFPSRGGKPTKAKKLCGSCPVQKECLDEAIRLKLEGFYAGTTFSERECMANEFGIKQTPLVDLMREYFNSNLEQIVEPILQYNLKSKNIVWK